MAPVSLTTSASSSSLSAPSQSSPPPLRGKLERQVNALTFTFRGLVECSTRQIAMENRSQRNLKSYLTDIGEVSGSSVLAERFPIANNGSGEPVDEIINSFTEHQSRFQPVKVQIESLARI